MSVAVIDTQNYLTCNEAAEKLGLSPDSVRRYCNNAKEGKTPVLHGVHVGRDWLIPKSEISRYQRERNERGRPASG